MSIVTNTLSWCFPGVQATPRGNRGLPLHSGNLQRRQSTRSLVDAKPEHRHFTWGRLVGSYWTDWVLIFALWAILLTIKSMPGHKREFSLRDLSIQHTFAEQERVPNDMLVFVSFFLPLIFLLPIASFVARNPWDVHNSFFGLCLSWTMSGLVTNLIKLMVGRPRPDLINRCLPKEGAHDHAVYGLSNITICTSKDYDILNDGFKSFPSGHSSLAFAGCSFLAFYLAGKMHLWDAYGNRNRAWFALSPLLLASTVAISRTMDNRHHWQDVLIGSTLGFIIAFIAYRTYYPHLWHESCHLPLLPRPTFRREDEFDDEHDAPHEGLLNDESGVPRFSMSEDDALVSSP